MHSTLDVQARDIPRAIHRAAKARAAGEGISLRAVLEEALRQYGSREWTPAPRWTPEPTRD